MIGEAGMHFQIKSILEARAQLSQDDFLFFFFPQRKGKKKERGWSPPCPCKVSIESCLLKPQLMGERGAECGASAAAAAAAAANGFEISHLSAHRAHAGSLSQC